jgi:hypothetical protein
VNYRMQLTSKHHRIDLLYRCFARGDLKCSILPYEITWHDIHLLSSVLNEPIIEG